MARPEGEGHYQPDTCAAADQQGPSIEFQCAWFIGNIGLSMIAGRSCPYPGAAKARSKMKRAGTLNFAIRPSRKRAQLMLRCRSFRYTTAIGTSPSRSSDAREYADFADRWACVAGRFDFGGRDVLAAADDDVLFAVNDEQIAVLVEVADIAGADEPVGREQGSVASGLRQ